MSSTNEPLLKRLKLSGELSNADLRGLPRPSAAESLPIAVVQEIIEQVRDGGDAALFELTKRFDKASIESIRVPPEEIRAARQKIATDSPDLERAIVAAHARILAFQETQRPSPLHFDNAGADITTTWTAVERAGCYVPGGRAVYPSSVLMTAVPARVAGVDEIALCVPPDSAGNVSPVTLAAADVAGVHEVYRVGGAQAIAAMAYGTETVQPVDVIVGPGNVYVATAMRLLSGRVGTPSAFAGPSEVVVIADETTPAKFVAWDLVVQAEHGPDGLAWLITWSDDVADEVTKIVEQQVEESPRSEEVRSTLRQGGYAVVVDSPADAIKVSNAIAPEHLQIMSSDPRSLVPYVRHAGAVFLGPLTPAAIGDYAAGPSHVLPVYGSGRYGSVLRVTDFMKTLNVIEVSERASLPAFDEIIGNFGRAENLPSHGGSVALRLNEYSPVTRLTNSTWDDRIAI